MLTAPLTMLEGEAAWICEELLTVGLVADCEPNLTCTGPAKSCPLRIVEVPPALGPSEGCRLGAGATVGATSEIVPGIDASTKLNPRLESPKRSSVSSASSICEATPWIGMSGTLRMSCPD